MVSDKEDTYYELKSHSNLYILNGNHGLMTNVGVFLVRVTYQRRDIICISLVVVKCVTLNTVLIKIAL